MDKKIAGLQKICALGVVPGMFFLGGCLNRAADWAEKVTWHETPLPTECRGWEQLNIKNRARYVLMREDPRLLVNIDAHNLRGRNLGCWK